MPALLRFTGRTRAYESAETARAHIEQRAVERQLFGPPPRLRRDVAVEFDYGSGWPVYTLTPKRTKAGHTERTVMYLHGGGWVNEITSQHWKLAVQIAAESYAEVIVPIYPLIPFATAAEVLPVIVDMAVQHLSRGRSVRLAGDSAGGQIAFSVALVLRDEHSVVIPQTVLISPVLDLSLSNPFIGVVEDPWLGRDALQVFADHWRGELALDDPRVNPMAADLRGFGSLTVFSGTRDILNPDTRLFVEKAAAAGVDVDYHEQPELLHVYPLTPTPEGRAARAVIVERLAGP
ncbi:alpha/beta hydrolase fold domain-containing protein [Mycobacterium vicinigordonae]|uniref:Alpha/beta hydrolase fold domain-containing protein n=1 Tax=Mycobacterium vicinigordonae TaxID=1719132 RepID=A0A7D6E0D3_9MYCO|nr:alpha/beta hydrolase fold domain-containing protein [Mycobacterium vicinigordonae]QLL05386.1 alpha/beta hydrolase fold domain-containing protein [Mycobacterium vicinigordonae]